VRLFAVGFLRAAEDILIIIKLSKFYEKVDDLRNCYGRELLGVSVIISLMSYIPREFFGEI